MSQVPCLQQRTFCESHSSAEHVILQGPLHEQRIGPLHACLEAQSTVHEAASRQRIPSLPLHALSTLQWTSQDEAAPQSTSSHDSSLLQLMTQGSPGWQGIVLH